MKYKLFLVSLIFSCSFFLNSEAARSISPDEAYLYFITPDNDQLLSSPVRVQFGLRGMGVAPAGVDIKNTGHHHLLVNTKNLPDLNKPIPSDSKHIHFGRGQTEVSLELKPGTHTLRLILGDKYHIPHNPPVISEPITINIEKN